MATVSDRYEDPYLNILMTAAAVKGFQGSAPKEKGKVASCVKQLHRLFSSSDSLKFPPIENNVCQKKTGMRRKNNFYRFTPLWESFSSEAIINAVKEGLGISFLPEQLVKEKIKTGQVATRHITGEQLVRMNYILWHKNKQLTPSLLNFIQICRELSSSIEVTN